MKGHALFAPVVGVGNILLGLLRVGARISGTSMEDLLRALADRLSARRAAELERQLERSVRGLAHNRRRDFLPDVEAFAEAEVKIDDPLRSTMSPPQDVHGVGVAFAHPVE